MILETNGRRWHDDATDYQRDQHKWSIPARHGFRLVFATWSDVTEHPERLVAGLRAALMDDMSVHWTSAPLAGDLCVPRR